MLDFGVCGFGKSPQLGVGMQISQIYLSDAGDQLPAQLQQCVDRVRRLHPEWEHRIYGLASLREFIANNFDVEVLKAYDKLKPYAYKADLGRYCLLYALGGWYFDISVRLLTAINPSPDIDVIAYREPQFQKHTLTCWSCSNTILYSKKGNDVFRLAIEQVVQNCREEYYGLTSLCPTGPTLLGRAFAMHGASKGFCFGDLMRLTPSLIARNVIQEFSPFASMSLIPGLVRRMRVFVQANKVVHAVAKKGRPGDLTALGAKGTNNYYALYNARDVYDSMQN